MGKKNGFLLHGKTLGVIGLGNIGKTLIKITRGFEFNVLAYDLKRDEEFANVNKVKYCSLENLLSSSDIVSIHVNLSDQTKNLFGFLKK